MGTTPPITTNNPQNTRSTKPDQASSYADGSHEPVRELVFLTLVEQEDGTWAVGNAEWH